MIVRLCVVAALMMPAAALAQGNPGPYGGLFGRTPEGIGGDYSKVEIRSSLGGVYDNALLVPEGEAVANSTQAGASGVARVDLILEHAADRLTASLRGGAARQEYFREPAFGANIYSADTRLTAKITTRLQAEAAAAYVRSPFFNVYQNFGLGNGFFGDNALTPFSQYASQLMVNETVDASAGVTSRLTRRSRLTASVNRRQTLFAEQSDNNFVMDGYQALWNLELGRGLGVHAGYGRARASYGRQQADQPDSQIHAFDHETIDAGIDFNRELSVARRTTLGFNTSTSFIKDTSSSDRHFRLNGGISLSKYFRRTWSARAEARRDTSFLAGFVEPIFSDTVGVSLSGMLSKRLNWMASAAGSKGHYGFSGRSGFETVSATTQLSVALGRHLGLYGQYVAYWNEVPKDSTTFDVPEQFSRHAVSIGLNAYLPLYNKTRRP